MSYPIFDTHVHLGSARHSGRFMETETMLELLSNNGVQKALAIPFPVVDDYHLEHDRIGQAIRQYPDVFLGCTSMYPYLKAGEYRDEVQRCVEEYGFRAMKFQPQYHPINPMSDKINFIFEIASEFNLPVICQTNTGIPNSLPSLYIRPARDFPEVKLILCHAGGSIFYHEAILAASLCNNVYLELSTLVENMILDILATIPSHKILIGSDLPECIPTEFGKIKTLQIAEADKENILWNTGEQLFLN